VDPQKIIMIEPIGDEPDGPLGVAVVEGGIRDMGADEGGERPRPRGADDLHDSPEMVASQVSDHSLTSANR
jgi:hypothetical protein